MGSKLVNNHYQMFFNQFQQTPGGGGGGNQFLPNPMLKIPSDMLDELISRFIMNIPVEERQDHTRVMFQVELAHWFFVDHYCSEDKTDYWKQLGRIKFPDFAYQVFQRTPFLQKELRNLDKILQDFREYKMRVPTFGGILMDEELSKVVLVQGFGGQWGFPKGKINKDEDPADCAAREVMEETGYDCSPLLNRNHFIESCCNERWTRLYIIRGVDRNAVMKPHTRYEIKNIAWFDISELPENKKDPTVVTRPGFPHTAFHTVFPYVKRLRRWIHDKVEGKNEVEFFRSNAPNRPDHVLDRGGGGDARKKRDSGSDQEARQSGKSAKKDGGKKIIQPQTQSKESRSQQQGMQLLNLLGTPAVVDTTATQKSSQKPPPNQAKSSAHQVVENSSLGFIKHINPKRRLFTSDEETDEVAKMTKLKISDSAASASSKAQSSKKVAQIFSHSLLVPSATWLNFKLDADEIIRSMALKPAKGRRK